jgi:general secretion pathway protein E
MQLSKLLVEQFQITAQDLSKAESYQKRFGGRLEQILVNMGSFPDDQIAKLYSEYLQLPLLQLEHFLDIELPQIDDEVLTILLANQWVPLVVNENHWQFACRFPLDLTINEWLSQQKIQPTIFLASESDIQALAAKFEQTNTNAVEHELVGDEEERLRELASEAPTVNLLNSLITRALRQGASDMHLEPYQGRYRARFRVDGVLHEAEML